MKDFERWKTLLGKRVVLTYRYETRDESAVIATGQLLGFGDGGDFEILEDDGFVHYGWPMLHCEEMVMDTERTGPDKDCYTLPNGECVSEYCSLHGSRRVEG